MQSALLTRISDLPQRFSARRPAAIGLDFGTERLNMVQVEYVQGVPRVRAAVSLAYGCDREALLANPAQLKRLLQTALRRKPFKGRRAVVSLPPSMVRMLVVSYRARPGRETEALVEAVRERTGEDLGGQVLDYMEINAGDSEHGDASALVAMAAKPLITAFLDKLMACGLDVAKLEVGPIAIKRLVAALDPAADAGTIVVINFGLAKSYVTVVSNKRLILDRDIDFSARGVVRLLAAELDVSETEAHTLLTRHGFLPEQLGDTGTDLSTTMPPIPSVVSSIVRPMLKDLAEEIRRLNAYISAETGGRRIDTIYALGALARWPHADALLSFLAHTRVKSINPFYGIEVDRAAADLDDLDPISGIAVATGLSLNEAA